MLADLQATLRLIEQRTGVEPEAGVRPFGIAEIDATLGGGLVGGALHEIAAVSERHLAAASGFALALMPRETRTVWVTQDMTLVENGALYGPGLDDFVCAPNRLINIVTARTRDLLWSMEEALHCSAIGVVIGELRDANIDPVALRRISLAAATHGSLAVMLRSTPSQDASTAATRWIVGAASSQPRYGPGPPCVEAQLVRNRRGSLGRWILEWSDTDGRLILAATHPVPVARPVAGRPVRAAVA